MFVRRLLERMSREKPNNHGPFTPRKVLFVCKRQGKASVQDENSLRQESSIPVQLVRKSKTDCRSVLG